MSETVLRGTAEVGELHTEMVPLHMLEPDPDNPREMGFGVEDVRRYLDSGTAPADGGSDWDALLELSDTIRDSGVIQLITVYRHLDRYRIATGERRYLASLLADATTIPARVYPDRPTNLKMLQFIENVQRQDLNLWERVNNVRGAINEWEESQEHSGSIGGTDLKKLLGISKTQAGQYLVLVSAPDDVEDYIKTERLKNLDKAATIARIKNQSRRAEALLALEKGATLEEVRDAAKRPSRKRSAAGRPKSRINLGTVADGCVVREILSRFDPKLAVHDVDWGDLTAAEAAWRSFVKRIEAQVA